MYSDSLGDFIEDHRPDAVFWTRQKISELALKAGLEVRVSDGRGCCEDRGDLVVTKWGEMMPLHKRVKQGRLFPKWVESSELVREHRDYILRGQRQANVVWEEVISGRVVTYLPYLDYRSHAFCEERGSPVKELLIAAGITPVEVGLPETVVTLPRAPWDESYSDCHGSGITENTLTCYRSEAPAQVLPFIQQLADLTGIKVTIG